MRIGRHHIGQAPRGDSPTAEGIADENGHSVFEISERVRVCSGWGKLVQPVWTRTARNNRSVQVVREDCAHCPGLKW